MTAAERAATAHSARVVLAALEKEHGRASLLNQDQQNREFIEWYKGDEKKRGVGYQEFALRRFLERLGAA